MQKKYKNNRIQKFILSISTMALVFASTMFATTASVSAHVDPVGCSATGGSVILTAYRADGVTPVGGGTVKDGDTIKYGAILGAAAVPACAFQNGIWTITTPDNVIHDVTPIGGVPQIGGVSGVANINSSLVSYVVSHANEVVNGTRHINASTNYSGGISHRNEGDSIGGPTLSTPEQTIVTHTPVVTTNIHNHATHAVITEALIGTVVHDQAIVTGEVGGPAITGTVDFLTFPSPDCSLTGATTTVGIALVGGVGESNTSVVTNTGLSYKAYYNGDSNYSPAYGICETLPALKLPSSVVTDIHEEPNHNVVLSIQEGGTVHDKATVTGQVGQPTPTGTVSFDFFTNLSCELVGVASGIIAVDGSGVAHPSTSQGPLLPGSYSFKAHYSGDANYLASDAACEPLSVIANGRIVVDKVTVPAGDPQIFNFTTTGAGYTGFGLADVSAPNEQSLVAGTYGVAETLPAGWVQTSATCSNGNPVDAVQVTPGVTVTCTFTNTKNGHLIVDKITLPAGDATVFNINATGGTVVGGGAGTVTDAANKDYEVAPGTYSVAETVPAGWTKTEDNCQNVVVPAGQTVTCTITNVKSGHIIVDKVTVPGGNTQSFAFTTTGAGYTDFSLTDEAAPNNQEVVPGVYTVSEGAVAGWDSDGGICDNGQVPTNITVAPGQTITCTYTNTLQSGHLIVQKTTLPAGDATVFNISASGTGTITGGGAGTITDTLDKDYTVTVGTYSVNEEVPAGWTKTADTCQNVTVAAGETKTCVITNTKNGHLIVQKTTEPVGDLTEFNINVTGGTVVGGSSGKISDATDKDFEVAPGTYTVNENLPKDWTQVSTTCDSVEVAPGETKTCLIVNKKIEDKRMTGGGSVFKADGSRVTHGFELHCDINALPNRLEVNWAGDGKGKKAENNFHLQTLTSAICTDNANLHAEQPNNTWDTYEGTGTGKLNGVLGATATWVFTDDGEPGKKDTATITIKDENGNVVLNVSGNLNSGNQQAH